MSAFRTNVWYNDIVTSGFRLSIVRTYELGLTTSLTPVS